MVTVCLVIFLPLALTSPYNTTLSICCIFFIFIKALKQIAIICTCSACSNFKAHREKLHCCIFRFYFFFHLIFASFIASGSRYKVGKQALDDFVKDRLQREQGTIMHYFLWEFKYLFYLSIFFLQRGFMPEHRAWHGFYQLCLPIKRGSGCSH